MRDNNPDRLDDGARAEADMKDREAKSEPLIERLLAAQLGLSMKTRQKAAALLRSQAERIAALEASHAAARENFHTMQNAANKLRIAKEAAEALLAEAGEALEKNVNDAVAAAHHIDEHSFSFALGILSQIEFTSRATLSRLKQGEKGGGE